jgi:hypothetical protein
MEIYLNGFVIQTKKIYYKTQNMINDERIKNKKNKNGFSKKQIETHFF